jgi:hypothetical protein
MEVFDRSLTNIPIELHTNYISNFQIKDIPVPDQFVWSGTISAVARLGSVAGPVIQATGKSTFEDGLRSGGSGSDFKGLIIWTLFFW